MLFAPAAFLSLDCVVCLAAGSELKPGLFFRKGSHNAGLFSREYQRPCAKREMTCGHVIHSSAGLSIWMYEKGS